MFTKPLRPLEPRSAVTEKRTLGYAALDFADQVLRVSLHPWQAWLLVHILELLPNGDLRFRTVLVLVARQNGKTMVSKVLALFFMYMLGRQLVIGTAQDLDVAESIWQEVVDLVLDGVEEGEPVRPDLAVEVADVVQTNGKKALVLNTGEKYKVKATSRRAARSLSADLILLDELREHQTWVAWGAITKTTMARAFALVLCLSNAGDELSVVLIGLRLMAHLALGNPDGLDEPLEPIAELEDEYEDDLGLFEWSAAPGCARGDRGAWAQANPSVGHPGGVSERAIASAARTDPDEVFWPEVMCQWISVDRSRSIDVKRWGDLADPQWPAPKVARFAVDVSEDRLHTSISACGESGGRWLVWVVRDDVGTSWLVGELLSLKKEKGLRRVSIAKASQAASLIPKIRKAGIYVDEVDGPAEAEACSDLVDAVRDGEIVHLGDPVLLYALLAAATAPIGDGKWRWRRKGAGNIASLGAMTLALAAAMRAATKAAWGSGAGEQEQVQQSGDPRAALRGGGVRDRERLSI